MRFKNKLTGNIIVATQKFINNLPDKDNWELLPELQPSLEELKQKKLDELKNNYQTWYENYLSKCPANERASFQEKAKEALAWSKDNNASTPILDAIIKGYGNTLTKADFVQAILSKVTYLAKQEGGMVAKRDAIKAATTIDELNATDISIKD